MQARQGRILGLSRGGYFQTVFLLAYLGNWLGKVSIQYLGRIWWKLQSHNFILKIFFLACAYNVVLITDQFWIKWFFGKNIIFWPKNAFFGRKWLFDPLDRSGPQSCFRTFCSGANFLHSMKKLHWGTLGLKCQTNFSIFTHTFLAIFHQF